MLTAVAAGNPQRILGIQEQFVDSYPSWRTSAAALERAILGRQSTAPTATPDPEIKDGSYIRKIRYEIGLSAKQLAAEANIAPSTLSRIEHGKVSGGTTMRRLLDVLEDMAKRRERR